jgi:putative acetyltransferase
MITFLRTDATHPDFKALVQLLDADLAIRDGEEHAFYHQFNKIDNLRHALVAYQQGKAVGCGALKAQGAATAELKRMYVGPDYRRQGIARRLLGELERWAGELGFQRLILETGKAQPEAIALYTHCQYEIIPNYGQYAGVENSVCMEKRIQAQE